MIKFRIVSSNITIEFPSEAEAQAHKLANNISEPIEEFNEDAIVEIDIIPDVTPRQFRQALVLSGISAANIEAGINLQAEPLRSLAMIEWEYSTAFKRNNPLVNQLAPLLGFTSTDLDTLWLLAGTL